MALKGMGTMDPPKLQRNLHMCLIFVIKIYFDKLLFCLKIQLQINYIIVIWQNNQKKELITRILINYR